MRKLRKYILSVVILLLCVNITAQEHTNDSIPNETLSIKLDSLLTHLPDSTEKGYTQEEISAINNILDLLSTGIDIKAEKNKKENINSAFLCKGRETLNPSIPLYPSFLVTINSSSKSVSLFLFCKQVHLYHFFRFCIK